MNVGLMMNIEKSNLGQIVKILPCIKSPTILNHGRKDWFDVFVITTSEKVRELIPKLKQKGACDIIEFPLGNIFTCGQ